MYLASKQKVQRTGIASLGWHLGRGFVQGTMTVKTDVWCVIAHGKTVAECRSRKAAEMIAEAMNATSNIKVTSDRAKE